LKISIITISFNSSDTIDDTIRSVLAQDCENLEYIIIDGKSTDSTEEIIKSHSGKIAKYISEKDNGIYDAMNKGIMHATGDIIGFLNADDVYAKNYILTEVIHTFKERNVDSCYGDLVYVRSKNINHTIRYWKADYFNIRKFYYGWMPPHPTFFVKNSIYYKYGLFNTDFEIASDYELMIRLLLKNTITTFYIPEVIVKMRTGGASNKNLKNLRTKTREDLRAWKVNNLKGASIAIFCKNFRKIPQFFKRHYRM
jgi:glycosyltransferase